jgi:hypothetical protein
MVGPTNPEIDSLGTHMVETHAFGYSDHLVMNVFAQVAVRGKHRDFATECCCSRRESVILIQDLSREKHKCACVCVCVCVRVCVFFMFTATSDVVKHVGSSYSDLRQSARTSKSDSVALLTGARGMRE